MGRSYQQILAHLNKETKRIPTERSWRWRTSALEIYHDTQQGNLAQTQYCTPSWQWWDAAIFMQCTTSHGGTFKWQMCRSCSSNSSWLHWCLPRSWPCTLRSTNELHRLDDQHVWTPVPHCLHAVGNTSGETGHQEDSGDLDDIIIHQVSITQEGTPSPDQ
jgi:hypothetical protein